MCRDVAAAASRRCFGADVLRQLLWCGCKIFRGIGFTFGLLAVYICGGWPEVGRRQNEQYI